jgi:tellurite resistance-related uncharacterized protein
MIDKHNAIFATYPQVTVIRGDVAYDKDENIVVYNEATIQSYIDAHAYIAKRQPEYPPLADLADALYHQSKGDETKLTAYLAKCEAVKQKYPKE